MNVLIFQTGEPLKIDGDGLRLMRAENLAERLQSHGHVVEIITSKYFHQKKEHRSVKVRKNFGTNYHLIGSPGYAKNIGLGRFYDHYKLALNLRQFLRTYDFKADVVFIGFPPIEAAYVLAKWCAANSIPFLMDVKDLWPEIFVDVIPRPLKWLGRAILLPYFLMTKWSLQRSSAISSISEPFLTRLLSDYSLTRRQNDFVAYLTTPVAKERRLLRTVTLPRIDDPAPKIFFAGSLTRVFDFKPLENAVKYLASVDKKVVFYICGDGPFLEVIKRQFRPYDNVVITGWVDNEVLQFLASKSVATLAPYRQSQDFELSVPNKIIESLSYGLPVLHSLKGHVQSLLSQADAGVYFDANSLGPLIEQIFEQLVESKSLSHNAGQLYRTMFDYHVVYDAIVDRLSFLSERNDCDN